MIFWLTNTKQKSSQTTLSWESIATCRFQTILWMVCRYSWFLQCNNISDRSSAEYGDECCRIIHSLIPSNPVDHNIAVSWCGQWMTCFTVSLSVRHLGHSAWFFSFQHYIHLLAPHILYDHFDNHHLCHIGRFFSSFCNTDMSVSTLEISLLCNDQYFKIQFLNIIFLFFWPNVSWYCMWCCGIT